VNSQKNLEKIVSAHQATIDKITKEGQHKEIDDDDDGDLQTAESEASLVQISIVTRSDLISHPKCIDRYNI
jgi:hypothetical protein